jgi:hypothetical protein
VEKLNPSEMKLAASRLCAECGLCCNGVLFHRVQLQARDSARELIALGLRLKRRKTHQYFLQPCAAFCGSHCAIYAARPERCRVFECGQLKRLAAGEITETMALSRIVEARRQVAELSELLNRAGEIEPGKPLSKRYENAIADSLVPLDADSRALRSRMKIAMQDLDELLDREFRIKPV